MILRQLLGRTPLGWIQLSHAPVRFAMAIAGVGFSVLLVFMQLGFMNMLFDTTVMMHRQIKADIVLVSASSRDFADLKPFGRRLLVKALGVEGVDDVEPLYGAMATWVKPGTDEKRNIYVVGVSPRFDAFVDPSIREKLARLGTVGSALFDEGSRGAFEAFNAAIKAGEEPIIEVEGRAVHFTGVYRLGASIGVEATMIVSDTTFAMLKPKQSPGSVNLGLIRLKPGEDPARLVRDIETAIADPDIKVLTVEGFVSRTRDYIATESPIAYIFVFGVVIGLLVGLVVVVQILSTDVQDHLPEYATFKAIGFTNGRLRSIVVEQAAILSVLGFVLGFLVSLLLYQVIKISIAMPVLMPISRVALVFGLTVAMCAIAGVIALRRVAAADPAEVF
jgi:putative ABC transport system permease protein